MRECLGKNCPNNCCSYRFKGLSRSLINTDKDEFVKIQLDSNEVLRIKKINREDLIVTIDGKDYLKLNDDNSCSAFKYGRCSIYDARPDVCRLYTYYFDPFCGICFDKNCPGNFDLEGVSTEEVNALLEHRINLFNESKHFYFDGYSIANKRLRDEKLVKRFIKKVNEVLTESKAKCFMIPYFKGKVKKDGGISAVLLGDNFHFTCHTFSYRGVVFIDCFGKDNCEKKLLPIILKYFPTTNFDLCDDNETGNFGKHVIFELKDTIPYDEAIELVKKILKSIRMTPISDIVTNYQDEKNYDILQPIAESHISIHAKNDAIIMDVFSCRHFNEQAIVDMLDDLIQSVTIVGRGVNFK